MPDNIREHAAPSARQRSRTSEPFSSFMRASGPQLREITSLIDAGVIEPVVDRVFPFASTNDAMAYIEKGCAKGKVVVTVRPTEEDMSQQPA